MDKPATNRFPMRRALGPALCLVTAMLLAGYLLLPVAAEHLIVPRLFEAAGIRDYDLSIQRWGITGLDAGTLRIGPEPSPGISVISLSADYSPGSLLQRRISRLTLTGVRILVREGDDSQFVIPGLPVSGAVVEEDRSESPVPLPLTVDAIHLKSGEIVLQRKDRHLRLPFEALVRPAPGMTAMDGTLKLELAGHWMTVNGRIDLADRRLTGDWDAPLIRLGLLAPLAGLDEMPVLSGSGGTSGRIQARWSPFAVDVLEADFRHTPCRLNWNGSRLDLSGATSGEEMHMRIRNDHEGNWTLETSPVRAGVPGGEGLFTLTGTLGADDDGTLSWKGRLASVISAAPIREDLPGLTLPLDLETTAQMTPEGRWQAGMVHTSADPPGGTLALGQDDIPLRLEPAAFAATAEGDRQTLGAEVRWRFPALEATYGDMLFGIGEVEGSARYREEEGAMEGRLVLTAKPVSFEGGGLEADLEQVRIEGAVARDAKAPFQLSGQVSVNGDRVRTKDAAILAKGLKVVLPLTWPPPEAAQPGEFSLAALTWNGTALGAAAGQLRQTLDGIAFRVRHDNRLLPGLRVEAEGAAGLAPDSWAPFANMRWTAERSGQAPPLALADLIPEPPPFPISFSGRIFARGEMAYRGALSGSLTAGVTEGRLQVDDPGLAFEGLQTALHLPDIGRLRSAPAQALTFESVTFGSIRAENGQLGYQIEPGGVLFMEGGRFQWCGGTVIAPATRFVPGENRYDLTVLCDRLKLDQLLEQLGLAQAEGGGAISGLIPVALTDGLLTFNNAFLYSTPGEGGVIRVQGSEVLTAGIPPGTPQYNQMELARHALKDYDYQWAKITMNTVAENLLVQLQFDGKPAGPLPFVYDPGAGGFVKTAPDQPGSVFQGIRLDVNVSLPLNRMLRYRELFKRLP